MEYENDVDELETVVLNLDISDILNKIDLERDIDYFPDELKKELLIILKAYLPLLYIMVINQDYDVIDYIIKEEIILSELNDNLVIDTIYGFFNEDQIAANMYIDTIIKLLNGLLKQFITNDKNEFNYLYKALINFNLEIKKIYSVKLKRVQWDRTHTKAIALYEIESYI